MTPLPWILLSLAVLFAFTPRWTRPDLYFAVTVQPDFAFTPQAQRILRGYWLRVALHTLIALGLASLIGLGKVLAVLVGIGWQIIGTGWAVACAHRATAKYSTAASPMREAMLSLRSRHLPGGWALALGPLALLAVTAVHVRISWDRLPQRIPVHWGLSGPNQWIDRTPPNVFGFLSVLASVCGVFLVISYGIVRWSRRVSSSGERARGESLFRQVIVCVLISLQYVVVVPVVLPTFLLGRLAVWPLPALTFVAIVATLITLIRVGQGGSRTVARAEFQPPIGDHTPDAAWKWGLIYYNPDDPALLVESRFGLGYTLNFGNGWSWVLMTVLLIPSILGIAFRR
jgi:uncharacterized membrane protein